MTAKAPSLLWRIAIRLTLVTIAASVVSYGWLYYKVRLSSNRVAEASLLDDARRIAGGVWYDGQTVRLSLPTDMAGTEDEAEGTFRYAVTDGSGRVLVASRHAVEASGQLPLAEPEPSLYLVHHGNGKGERFYGAQMLKVLRGRPLTVQVERVSIDETALVETSIDEFFEHGAWVSGPFLAVLLLISVATIKSSMSPLLALSREAGEIGPSSPGRRLPVKDVPREALPLVQSLNAALDRLDAGIAQQRAFTADAAHELRTPLAVLRAHADTLTDESAARSLRNDIDQMTRIVAQLLKVAQIDAAAVEPGETTDLGEVAISVASLLIPIGIAQGRGVEVILPEQPCIVAGNREIIFLAVRNLAENALRYAPLGTSVDIAVSDDASVRVTDRGPGVPLDLRQRIFTRFWRADRSSAGAGLGLAIVTRAMELHGGSVEVADTPGGGATFILRFPHTLPDLRRSEEKGSPRGNAIPPERRQPLVG